MFNKAKIISKLKRQQLRGRETPAEKKLWSRLRKLRKEIGIVFRRQHSFEWFIVDFYCPSHRLAIEVDGSIHNLRNVKLQDQERQKIIEEQGIKFLRFTNKQVLDDIDSVLKIILSNLTI